MFLIALIARIFIVAPQCTGVQYVRGTLQAFPSCMILSWLPTPDMAGSDCYRASSPEHSALLCFLSRIIYKALKHLLCTKYVKNAIFRRINLFII